MIKKLLPIIAAVLLFSCKKDNTTAPSNSPGSTSSDLSGTKWQIYEYKDATSSTPQSRNDTLIFTDATHYTYNHHPYNYYLSNGEYIHLSLYGTPFGDIDGTVPNNFIANGEIIAVPFSQLVVSGLTYNLWFKKI